jgi:nicotinamide mononucleotide adenylyltransferase
MERSRSTLAFPGSDDLRQRMIERELAECRAALQQALDVRNVMDSTSAICADMIAKYEGTPDMLPQIVNLKSQVGDVETARHTLEETIDDLIKRTAELEALDRRLM